MGGEAKRKRLLREAAGVPDDGFRVRIQEPSWHRRRREKVERRGVLLPVAASTRNDRRLGKKDAEGNPLAAPIPVTKEAADMLFGPVREHNEKIRRGEASRTERIEIEQTIETKETDDGPDRTAAAPEDRGEAAPDPA